MIDLVTLGCIMAEAGSHRRPNHVCSSIGMTKTRLDF